MELRCVLFRSAASEVIAEKAQEMVGQARRAAVLQGTIAAIAFALAVVSFVRVKKTADAMFHDKELAEVTLHSIGDAVITTDAGARVEYLNPIAETLTGWSTKEAKGRPLSEVFHIIYDVTLMRNSTHLLSYHATHDALTGLINRREFERRLTRLVENAKLCNAQHVLCYLDLDQFKVVNDTCGHIAGDKLLRQLAFQLKDRIRDSDTIARLRGDEFGVLLESCPLDAARRLTDGLIRVVNDFRFVWEGKTFEIGVSIGMVRITPESASPVDLMSQADSACYAAKEKGRNRVQIYEPGDTELLQRQGEMHWVGRIQKALNEDRFTLYSQPIKPLLNGADHRRYREVLLRMVDDAGNNVPTMEIIHAPDRY